MAPMDHGSRNERKREPPWGMGKGSVHRMVSDRGAMWSNPPLRRVSARPRKKDLQTRDERVLSRRARVESDAETWCVGVP